MGPVDWTLDELFNEAYERLRALAGSFYEREHGERTFTPTAVVHEAYIALRNSNPEVERGAEYFYACAATAMRRYMLDAARARKRLKRGGGAHRVCLSHALDDSHRGVLVDLLTLEDAMGRLEEESDRAAKVAEYRLFAGMEIAGIARVLGVSPRTVSFDWRFARAYLHEELTGENNGRRLNALLRSDADESVLDTMAERSADAISRAHAAPLPLGIPPTIGRYTLTRCVSSGGSSLVCEGKPVVGGEPVAIKILRSPNHNAAHALRFEREVRALRRIQHEGVVRILDQGMLDTGEPYIVMDLVRGQTLEQCDAVRNAPIDVRTDLIRRIAEAAHQLHLRGVVHRDLKPSNIMVRPDGAPVIIDLGIAIMEEAPGEPCVRVTQTGFAPGTPEYMSPEQLAGAELDARSDVYALGAIAYWLLGGAVPIDVSGLSPAAAETRVAREIPVPIERRAPQSRGDLSCVVGTALAKRPEERYSSAAELAMELSRVLVGDPISVSPPSVGRRIARWSRRHRGRVRTGVALGAILLVAGGAVAFAAQRAQREAARADRLEAGLDQSVWLFPNILAFASKQRLGPDASIEDIFTAAIEDTNFETMTPEVRAASYAMIARSFITLIAHEKALPYARLSAEAHDGLHGPGNQRSLRERIQYARLLQNTGDLDGAEREIRRVRANAPKDLDAAAPPVAAQLLGREGRVALARGRVLEAEHLLLASRRLWAGTPSANPVMVPGTDLWLGRVYRAQGRFGEATRVLERGLGFNNELRHDMHPRSVRLRVEIALVHADLGDITRAVLLLLDELERCEADPRIDPDDSRAEQRYRPGWLGGTASARIPHRLGAASLYPMKEQALRKQLISLSAVALLCAPVAHVVGADCNSNGIDDSIDVESDTYFFPLYNSSCHSSYTFSFGSLYTLPQHDTDLNIRVELLGFKTHTTSRYVDVLVNGSFAGRLFEDDGTNCTGVDFDIVTIPWIDVPDLDSIVVTLDMSNAECCGPAPYVACVLQYDVYSDDDLNQNGVVDSCECLADLDADGDADSDDIDIYTDWYLSGDPRADFEDDEVLNLDDLTAFTDAYNACS
eukprot:g5437.t1